MGKVISRAIETTNYDFGKEDTTILEGFVKIDEFFNKVIKRLESFIKENMPRYKTRPQQGNLYVETIFSRLQVEYYETIIYGQGVSYLISYEERLVPKPEIILIEDQVIEFFKDLYDEEVRLEDEWFKNIKEIKE